MDLSILQKVNELVEQGKDVEEIKRELQTQGIAPDAINEALNETGASRGQAQQAALAPVPTPAIHHEKVIQPSPGFNPQA